MTYSMARVRHYLQEHSFEKLFIDELGWNRHAGELPLTVDDHDYTLTTVSEKLGVLIWRCSPGPDGTVPPRATRQKIEKQATQSAYEHLIIYENAARAEQVWQWVMRQPGEPARYREDTFRKGQAGDLIAQKLSKIAFTLKDEATLGLFDVVARMRDAFDRDKVTKRFYDDFRTEHGHFLTFIEGVAEQSDREWYASVMLNRLMFVYFIQQKGFLDGDQNYLQSRLDQVRGTRGPGQFYTFYRHFLRRLFHEGFGQQPEHRVSGLDHLLGKVPYLNGGLFEPHELEQRYPDIDISDEAFEQLFDFFGQWQWHLDDRPLAGGREINPDVLGYIFEKYINQKQMGAYYTKEDITGYICKSTIVPHLFDQARKHCDVAFQPNAAVWRLLQEDPDRYIYEPVRRGVIRSDGTELPETELPDFVQVGMHDPQARMFDRRYNLGQADLQTADGYRLTLPTETWREYVARRSRCLELHAKLAAGEVREINDLVTLNLDLRQFAQDAIEQCEGPEQLRAFWKSANTMTVLDPTCGSGAFLFAALNILEPVYDACLDRMQAFVDDLDASGEAHSPRKFEDLRKTLRAVERHPNRDYFILKSIMVNNLYGVDIMPEAVEICKLRLFLKLVAQVDRVELLEPLPDIDFNIRAGNTLIGYATIDEIRRAAAQVPVTGKDQTQATQIRILDPETDAVIRRIEEDAELVDRAFTKFHEMQSDHEMDATEFATAKGDLRKRLDTLSSQLDNYLAREYGVDLRSDAALKTWQRSHQPFHWIVEFYGIVRLGGFDAVVGNPPYRERSKLNGEYRILRYQTEACRDIYAWFVEQSISLLHPFGRLGLIVPVSIASSDSFAPARTILATASAILWTSHYANRPAQLFEGAQNRLSIILASRHGAASAAYSSRYHRWNGRKGERSSLLSLLDYYDVHASWQVPREPIPKIGTSLGASVIRALRSQTPIAATLSRAKGLSIFWVRVPGYFCQFYLEPPMARPEGGGNERIRGEVCDISLPSLDIRQILHCVLNSTTYYLFYSVFTDGRHINPSDVRGFPFNVDSVSGSSAQHYAELSEALKSQIRRATQVVRKSGLLIDSVDSKAVKPTLDLIDRLLATHYGFTDEELDFIVNYDIKYRMGADANTEIDP